MLNPVNEKAPVVGLHDVQDGLPATSKEQAPAQQTGSASVQDSYSYGQALRSSFSAVGCTFYAALARPLAARGALEPPKLSFAERRQLLHQQELALVRGQLATLENIHGLVQEVRDGGGHDSVLALRQQIETFFCAATKQVQCVAAKATQYGWQPLWSDNVPQFCLMPVMALGQHDLTMLCVKLLGRLASQQDVSQWEPHDSIRWFWKAYDAHGTLNLALVHGVAAADEALVGEILAGPVRITEENHDNCLKAAAQLRNAVIFDALRGHQQVSRPTLPAEGIAFTFGGQDFAARLGASPTRLLAGPST